MSADTPVLMQLLVLDLKDNQLVGTLPESWGSFTNVSQWRETAC